ncbi:hypothetical protein JTB14_020083 [Gonioctena quinquepunctata]|nr:hypothetical protein JTB14_020083 [Gonioctena quinquepunctata]
MYSSRNYDDYEERNRQIVLEGTQILERTGESLNRSHQIAVETEQIGNEVVSELGQQRESLLRTRDRLEDANEHLSTARAALKKMSRNVIYNKVILILIIVTEVLILVTLSYLKFFRKS